MAVEAPKRIDTPFARSTPSLPFRVAAYLTGRRTVTQVAEAVTKQPVSQSDQEVPLEEQRPTGVGNTTQPTEKSSGADILSNGRHEETTGLESKHIQVILYPRRVSSIDVIFVEGDMWLARNMEKGKVMTTPSLGISPENAPDSDASLVQGLGSIARITREKAWHQMYDPLRANND